jgi:hypothetical protein
MKEEMLKQLKEVDIFQKKLEEAKKSFIEWNLYNNLL